MLCEFKADAVLRVVTTMSRVATVVNTSDILVGSIAETTGRYARFKGQQTVDQEHLPTMINDLDELAGALTAINAPFSVLSIQRLRADLQTAKLTYGGLEEAYNALHVRVRDELGLTKFLAVSRERQKYYQPPEPIFGPDVASKFPSAAFEIDEACKCLALDRSTAAVFHLMRVMEVGIRAMARSLAIPDPLKPAERNWGAILKVVESGIQTKWPNAAARMHGDGALFEALHASLDAVKNPWRNATMHVENKYTDDEAEHILIAVKGFMKKLASRMDEDGKPLA